MNGQQLALIKIVGCENGQHRIPSGTEFKVELDVTLRLVPNAVPHLIYDLVPVDLYTMLSSVYLRSTSIDRHDIKIKIKELTNGSNRNHVTKYVIATPASQQDVPPSIGISPPAGHIQHASASDSFGVGSGNANDSDGRTALAASSFRQGLTVDAMAFLINSAKNIGSAGAPTAPGGLRENGGDTTGIGKALPLIFARNRGSVV
jgi:hypothetical protein